MNAHFALIAEPRRQAILQMVWRHERSAGDIAAALDEISFSAVSQHLARLREAGLVEVRRNGRKRYYRADRSALGAMAPLLEAMWAERLDALARLAEAEDAERGLGEADPPSHSDPAEDET